MDSTSFEAERKAIDKIVGQEKDFEVNLLEFAKDLKSTEIENVACDMDFPWWDPEIMESTFGLKKFRYGEVEFNEGTDTIPEIPECEPHYLCFRAVGKEFAGNRDIKYRAQQIIKVYRWLTSILNCCDDACKIAKVYRYLEHLELVVTFSGHYHS